MDDEEENKEHVKGKYVVIDYRWNKETMISDGDDERRKEAREKTNEPAGGAVASFSPESDDTSTLLLSTPSPIGVLSG